MYFVAFLVTLLSACGFHLAEGYTDPELTIHHDSVSMKLICSTSPGVTGYTWKLNNNTILQDNCIDTSSEFMSTHCYPNGTVTLYIKDEWTQNPLGTWKCIVYYPNATKEAVRNISAHEAVLLNQTDYDNIALTCSYTMPNNIRGFRWTMGGTVVGAYWSESCSTVGTDQLPGYSVKCEGKKTMTLVVQPDAIHDSMKEWTCGVVTHSTDDYIHSTPLQLNVSPRVAPFIKLETIIRVRQDETVVLRIDVLSNPPPVFSWYKLTDTDQWTPVGRFKQMTVVSESLQSILTIPMVGPDDVGRYKMVASNGYGRSFVQEYEVSVEGTSGQGSSRKTVMVVCVLVGVCLVLVTAGLGVKYRRSSHRPRPRPRPKSQSPNRATRALEPHYCTIDESEPQPPMNNGVTVPMTMANNATYRKEMASGSGEAGRPTDLTHVNKNGFDYAVVKKGKNNQAAMPKVANTTGMATCGAGGQGPADLPHITKNGDEYAVVNKGKKKQNDDKGRQEAQGSKKRNVKKGAKGDQVTYVEVDFARKDEQTQYENVVRGRKVNVTYSDVSFAKCQEEDYL